MLERTEEAKLPTKYGSFRIVGFTDRKGNTHVALIKGDVFGGEDVLVRIHSSCLTGESFGSQRCDCGEQLKRAMKLLEAEGRGVIVYLQQEGRGIGLSNKLRVYHMQDEGFDTVSANVLLGFRPDERSYEIAASILKDLGVRSVILLTSNTEKIRDIERRGIKVKGFRKFGGKRNPHNTEYMEAKKKRMGHLI